MKVLSSKESCKSTNISGTAVQGESLRKYTHKNFTFMTLDT